MDLDAALVLSGLGQIIALAFFAGKVVALLRELERRTAKLEAWREDEARTREQLWYQKGVERRRTERRQG